ncbi:MAG: T9SS type A sorting domain-containing protein [Bacteroidales bacterium]|nr:T9SS type A sorting domain-containing protein [Bacteroidales bacterium]
MEQSGHARPGSSGSTSVRLVPKSAAGVTANGNLTNGRMNAGSMTAAGSSNYNYTQRSQSAYNTPITMLPDSMAVWVCFRSTSTSVEANVKAVVHGDADYQVIANGTEDPANMHVATANMLFTRTAPNGGDYNWRRLSIPFVNNGPCTDVRYILFIATTNKNAGQGSTSDDLFIDDVLLIYNPTLSMGNLASTSFTPGATVTIPFTLTGTMSPDNLNATANAVIAQMSDANGSFSNPTELGRVTTNTSGNITAQIPNVANGQYQIRVISTNYPMIGQNAQQVTITVPSYTIAVNANPTEGGTVTGGGEYTSGQSCTVTATANAGYTFTNWTEGGNVASTNASYTFNVTGNRTLVANFALNTYSITATADPTAGGTVTGAGTYNHGASCTLTATANTSYTFVNWTKNGTQVSTNASYTFTVSEAGSYVAHFSLNSYNVTATANPTAGGTVSGAGEYNHGASCTLTATANTGYTFTNWTENGSVVSSNANYTFTVTGNRTLVANFTLNSYTIAATANPTAGGTVSGAGEFNHGASCTLTATANTGYTFTNWTENGSVVSSNANYTFTVTGNRTLVANFTLNTYTIATAANPAAGGTVSGDGEYNHGESCTVTATANTGYTFSNWTENGTVVSTNSSYTFTVEGNRNLVANFSNITYTITVSANPSNSGTATGGGTYNHGQSCTVIATSADGYTFTNWTENGSVVSTNANYTFTVTGDRALVANFEEQAPDTYNINVSPNPNVGGTVTGGGNYMEGEQCTVTATANNGYTFVQWTENGNQVSTDASYTFTVAGNRTLVAEFQIQSYTISAAVNPSNSGVITGVGDYEYGQSCTLVATANEGYTFTNWTEDGNVVSTNANYIFTVSGSRELIANFSTNAYTITATADPMEGGTVTGSGNYEYGATCTLTATANYEYTFVKWTKNGEEVSTDATFTFTVTASEDYVAHFDGPDAIEEVTIECQIFPNPFTSMVSIKAEKALKTVSVYDIYGRLLKEQKVSDMEIELDMSDLSNGAYLLKLDYGDSSSVHRIMKVRK